MYTGLNQYYVVMEVDPRYQLSPDSLNNIYIKASTTTGAAASVSTLGTTTPAAATATAAVQAAASSAPASALSGAAAVFPTSGGALVTSSTTSGATATTSTSTTANPVATNIAAIAASANESTTVAAIALQERLLESPPQAHRPRLSLPQAASRRFLQQRAYRRLPTMAQWFRSLPLLTGSSSALRSPSTTRDNIRQCHIVRSRSPTYTLGDAVTALQKAQADMGLPTAIHATFQGTAQAFQDSLKNEPYLILAALVRGLHCPRHPIRESDSPANDSFHPAAREGVGASPRAADYGNRSQHPWR